MMVQPVSIAAPDWLAQQTATVEAALDQIVAGHSSVPPALTDVMRYSLLGGGKRLRPVLVLECCRLCRGTDADAWPAAVAIECVHAFSLIHDDLPAMDDDDLRRGRPTCHRVYGEAMAILAGDALLTLAFQHIADSVVDANKCRSMMLTLARATGPAGMIGGQVLDINAGVPRTPTDSSRAGDDRQLVVSIHRMKTARLMSAACVLGGLAAGATPDQLNQLNEYGDGLGLAFQAMDDLLDLSGTAEQLGKKTRKDVAAGKLTLPGVVGEPVARRLARQHAERACLAAGSIGGDAARLLDLAQYCVERVA